MKNVFLIFLLSLSIVSCGEEVLTQSTQSTSFSANDLKTFELNTCSQMHFEKPPVDILFVVDNSGSSLLPSFQQLKEEIGNIINDVSPEFDYHIYIAPLMANAGDSLSQYPIIANDQSSFNTTALNFIQMSDLQMFEAPAGNNVEYGFQRVMDLIDANRDQAGKSGIFRNNANTVVIMISNGDDNQAVTTIGGNQVVDNNVYTNLKNQFLSYSEKYAQANSVSSPMNAESLRFISLVAHNTCNTGWKRGSTYISMSSDVYDYMGYVDDPAKDTVDLCGTNYAKVFKSINESIHAVIVGHKYDHWKISSASEADIQSDDITVHKILKNGTKVSVPVGQANGFEYVGHKSNFDTRYAVMKDIDDDGQLEEVLSAGEPKTGLMIQLNGSARIEYPQCIIAKTRTPTEYFGFIALPREPQVSTITVSINGKSFSQKTTDGWSYIGWRDTKNVKVPGPTNAAVTPALNKTGYFIQLHGDALLTNGDDITVNYKPASL